MSVFLILVFAVNGGTINSVQPMPDMKTCKKALKLHVKVIPRPTGWITYGISTPVLAECKEIK